MKLIGVVGAGIMGRGVSQCFAQAGYSVILIDIDLAIIDNAKSEIHNNLRFQVLLKKDKISESTEQIINRIEFSTDYESCATNTCCRSNLRVLYF